MLLLHPSPTALSPYCLETAAKKERKAGENGQTAAGHQRSGRGLKSISPGSPADVVRGPGNADVKSVESWPLIGRGDPICRMEGGGTPISDGFGVGGPSAVLTPCAATFRSSSALAGSGEHPLPPTHPGIAFHLPRNHTTVDGGGAIEAVRNPPVTPAGVESGIWALILLIVVILTSSSPAGCM